MSEADWKRQNEILSYLISSENQALSNMHRSDIEKLISVQFKVDEDFATQVKKKKKNKLQGEDPMYELQIDFGSIFIHWKSETIKYLMEFFFKSNKRIFDEQKRALAKEY